MLFFLARNTFGILNNLRQGIGWVLNNSKTIAMFALVLSAEAASAKPIVGRRNMITYDCGTFEIVGTVPELSETFEPLKPLISLKKPFGFTAKDEDDKIRECFTTEESAVYCTISDFSNKDKVLHITALNTPASKTTCEIYNRLYQKTSRKQEINKLEEEKAAAKFRCGNFEVIEDTLLADKPEYNPQFFISKDSNGDTRECYKNSQGATVSFCLIPTFWKQNDFAQFDIGSEAIENAICKAYESRHKNEL